MEWAGRWKAGEMDKGRGCVQERSDLWRSIWAGVLRTAANKDIWQDQSPLLSHRQRSDVRSASHKLHWQGKHTLYVVLCRSTIILIITASKKTFFPQFARHSRYYLPNGKNIASQMMVSDQCERSQGTDLSGPKSHKYSFNITCDWAGTMVSDDIRSSPWWLMNSAATLQTTSNLKKNLYAFSFSLSIETTQPDMPVQ